jgi:hypothetical protein
LPAQPLLELEKPSAAYFLPAGPRRDIKASENAMKLSWLRLIVSAMIIFAAVLGSAASFGAPLAHDCASMSVMDKCPDHADDHATAPRHCDSLVCGALELTPTEAQAPTTLTTVSSLRLIFDDAAHLGLSAPPDLRPPII